MAVKTTRTDVNRRKFLAGAAVAGAATALPAAAKAQTAADSAAFVKRPSTAAAEAEMAGNVQVRPGTINGIAGSDFMVDVMRSLDIDYVFTNPASSCRGIHESIVNYGSNKKPELITCMHEESAVAMTHGYFKVAGKPAAALCHGTVGLQHAAMAMYNAWCDRAASIVLVGNRMDAATRQPGVPTAHSVQDPGALTRDFTKWDDNPQSLQHFAESMVRAYKITMTPPYEPVLIALEEKIQEQPIETEHGPLIIPKLNNVASPSGDPNALREAARMLAMAANPVIIADRCARTPQGIKNLVALAETLNCPVIDQLGRMNMPNNHYLFQMGGASVPQADVILGLELTDFWGSVNDSEDSVEEHRELRIKPGTKLISITTADLYIRANYQDFQRYQAVDISIGADAETSLPMLTEYVKQAIPADRRSVIAERGEKAKKAHVLARERTLQAAAASAWNAIPVSSARLSAEIWALIKNENWALVSRDSSLSNWPHRLWNFDQYHQFIGGPGGAGIGYGLPAAVGAAFAHRSIDPTRLCINLQNDGDSMFAPGALWTQAHHSVPMLTVMWNNRAYHQEVMHLQRTANWRQRDVSTAHVGTVIRGPNIDFAKLAQSMGVNGIGPITDPKDLAVALRRGIDAVKAGEPTLIDVVCQPR
ncbi:MAG: thiamine pyrophosphate-binding protein [Alphaproteobacteria bacterium]|nr:thiamine pyrophosphate-binding protein [Alphaproteobacteria bacterium]